MTWIALSDLAWGLIAMGLVLSYIVLPADVVYDGNFRNFSDLEVRCYMFMLVLVCFGANQCYPIVLGVVLCNWLRNLHLRHHEVYEEDPSAYLLDMDRILPRQSEASPPPSHHIRSNTPPLSGLGMKSPLEYRRSINTGA